MAESKPASDRPTATTDDLADTSLPVEAAAEPEPLTPEKAFALDRYYDRYVIAGALLLVAVATAHKISDASTWSALASGRELLRRGILQPTDFMSFASAGKPWVNISWLFEVVSFFLYDSVAKVFAADPGRAEQFAGGTLVVLTMLIRVATAGMLFRLLKPGPGPWWAAIVLVIALGLSPFPTPQGPVFSIGGLAQQARVAPDTWGLLLLAWELVLIEKAFRDRCMRSLCLLPVLIALWANIDETFLIGILVLAAAAAGQFLARRGGDESDRGISPVAGMLALAAGAAAAVVNPSLWRVYPVALEPFLQRFTVGRGGSMTVDQLSFFGADSAAIFGADLARSQVAYFVIVVGIGLLSFVLNRRRFQVGRLLVYLIGVALWALLIRFGAVFAVLWAAALIQNGQEWYLDRFGAQGRIGLGWRAFAVGGRSVSILGLFVAVALTLTGLGLTATRFSFVGQPPGIGVQSSLLAFEAADFLKSAEIQGRIVNLSVAQGGCDPVARVPAPPVVY
jgi:hypothetical protein